MLAIGDGGEVGKREMITFSSIIDRRAVRSRAKCC